MIKRTIILLAVLLALSLSLASTASADEISGTGTIWAKGVGQAILRGDGEINIQGHGVGIIWIKNAETLEAAPPSSGAGGARSRLRVTTLASG